MDRIKALARLAGEIAGWIGAHALLLAAALAGEDGPIRQHPRWTGACVLLIAGIVAVGVAAGFRIVLYAVAIVALAAFLVWLFVSASRGPSSDG